jgi:DNA ligase-1
MFEEQITAGLEGVMIKKLDAPYKAGNRGFHWIKFKRMAAGELSDTIDCVLLGIYSGTGKRTEFGVGGLLVGLYDTESDSYVTVSRIGTGLTDDEWRKVNEIGQKIKIDKKPARVNAVVHPSYWVEPKEVLEIFADEITRSPVHTAGKKGPPAGGEPGYALRFPRLISFRGADKRPEDATTVKELIKMYEQQKKVKLSK